MQIVEKLLEKMESNMIKYEDKMEGKVESTVKKQKIKRKVDIINWVDPDCQSFKSLVLSGSTITANKGVEVFGKNKIVGEYTFTATLSNIDNNVYLGVIDTLNKNGWKNYNRVCYSNDCYSYCNVGGDSNKGSGFKAGERVTVAIDLKQGSIQWRVGSDIRLQETVSMLKDKSITWVPFI